MTHSEAVAIARSGEGAIVAELFRLTAENARLLDHVRFLQSQVYGKDVIIDEPFEERDRPIMTMPLLRGQNGREHAASAAIVEQRQHNREGAVQ